MNETYTHRNLPPENSFNEFRKKVTTKAVRMVGPFKVVTREGVLECDDGWLAIDSGGWPYPISAQEFARIYEPVDEHQNAYD